MALTPLEQMGTPSSPQCSHRTSPAGDPEWWKSRIDGRTLSKLSVPWCVLDWAKFKPPELRARGRRNALANVTENRTLTVQSYNTQLPSDRTSTSCEWADRACLEWCASLPSRSMYRAIASWENLVEAFAARTYILRWRWCSISALHELYILATVAPTSFTMLLREVQRQKPS